MTERTYPTITVGYRHGTKVATRVTKGLVYYMCDECGQDGFNALDFWLKHPPTSRCIHCSRIPNESARAKMSAHRPRPNHVGEVHGAWLVFAQGLVNFYVRYHLRCQVCGSEMTVPTLSQIKYCRCRKKPVKSLVIQKHEA